MTAIDRAARCVHLESGQLATGARNRVPDVPGIEFEGVFGIRTLADADALAPRLSSARQVVVIGAGFIGLEFAAVAAARGAAVHVLEVAERPMARALSRPMSELFSHGHAALGVKLEFGQAAARLIGEAGHVTGVQTADDRVLPADLVVYGVGVLPNVELAAAAGLAVENGIRVDDLLLTSDPCISAIGDAVSYRSPWAPASSRAVRLESVQNAVDQAKAVAARLMGKPAAYSALPWFWSDQGDMRLQIAGLSEGCDQTVQIGSIESRQLTVLCFRAGRLIAVETTNRTPDHMAARKLLLRATPLTPQQAAEPGFDLKAFEASTRDAA